MWQLIDMMHVPYWTNIMDITWYSDWTPSFYISRDTWHNCSITDPLEPNTFYVHRLQIRILCKREKKITIFICLKQNVKRHLRWVFLNLTLALLYRCTVNMECSLCVQMYVWQHLYYKLSYIHLTVNCNTFLKKLSLTCGILDMFDALWDNTFCLWWKNPLRTKPRTFLNSCKTCLDSYKGYFFLEKCWKNLVFNFVFHIDWSIFHAKFINIRKAGYLKLY